MLIKGARRHQVGLRRAGALAAVTVVGVLAAGCSSEPDRAASTEVTDAAIGTPAAVATTGKPGLRTCYTNGYDVPFRVVAYTTWDDPMRDVAPGAKTCFDVEFVSPPETERNRVAIFGEVVPNLGNVSTWIFPDKPGGGAFTVFTCWTASCKNTDPMSESVMAVGDVRPVTYGSAIIDLTRGPDVQGMISLDLEIRPR